MSFEDDLRMALARRDPPPGFAERVIARAQAPRPRRTPYRFAAWAAAAALTLGCGFEYYRYREARQAREQAVQALRIAGKQFMAAQKKLERLNLMRTRAAEVPENQ
jgi:hypothetical protein